METAIQLDLPTDPLPGAVPEADLSALRGWLKMNGWQTRKQICDALSGSTGSVWSERRVRETAEALGAEIVRGQAGFKLTESITREELGLALQAADAFLSQSKKMMSYGMALKHRLHQIVG